MQSHCTVWHLLSALAPASPWTVAHVARCSQGHSHKFRHLRHQDSISPDACKGIEIELSEIPPSPSFVPLITIGIVHAPSSSCLPPPRPWRLESVHESGRHVIGSAEQDIGVVPAWLGLVGEPVCVVESFQRGVDVVVVPT